jgi:hypothetical protein
MQKDQFLMMAPMSLCKSFAYLKRLNPVTNFSSSSSSLLATSFKVPCRALMEVFQENLTIFGYPKTGSLFF